MNHLVRSSFWPFVVDGALKICYLTLHRILLDLLCILQKRKRLVFRVLITSLDSFTVCFVSTVLYRIWQTSSICFSLFCVYLSIYYLSVYVSIYLSIYIFLYLSIYNLITLNKFLDTSDLVFRSSHPEVFLRKVGLKICNKFTEEHPCRSAISIKVAKKILCVSQSIFR